MFGIYNSLLAVLTDVPMFRQYSTDEIIADIQNKLI